MDFLLGKIDSILCLIAIFIFCSKDAGHNTWNVNSKNGLNQILDRLISGDTEVWKELIFSVEDIPSFNTSFELRLLFLKQKEKQNNWGEMNYIKLTRSTKCEGPFHFEMLQKHTTKEIVARDSLAFYHQSVSSATLEFNYSSLPSANYYLSVAIVTAIFPSYLVCKL